VRTEGGTFLGQNRLTFLIEKLFDLIQEMFDNRRRHSPIRRVRFLNETVELRGTELPGTVEPNQT